MQVTKVSFKKPTNPQAKALANCSITFDNCFVVSGFKICDGRNGPFLSVPGFKDRDSGEYIDTSFPITKEYRTILLNAGLQFYNKWLAAGCPEAAPKQAQPGYTAPPANYPPAAAPQQNTGYAPGPPQAAPQQQADYGIQWGQPQKTFDGITYLQGVPTPAFTAAWTQNRNALEQQGWTLDQNIVYKKIATEPPMPY